MAERARSRKSSRRENRQQPPPGHNSLAISEGDWDDIYRRWLPRIEVADRLYEEAVEKARNLKGELASVYKAAVRDGCRGKGIKDAYRKMKLVAEEVALDAAATARVIRLKNHALHEQYDLFGLRRVAPDPFLAGQQVGRAGAPKEPPYILGTAAADLWCNGWDNGQAFTRQTLLDKSSSVGHAGLASGEAPSN
jgi:hypothetical protein